MDKETIKSILLAHGYTIKPGCDDLRDYVYKAAFELLELAAPAVQGEVVGWQFYQDGKWWNGDDRIKDHKRNTQEAGFRVRDVYVAPQPEEQRPASSDKARAEFEAWANSFFANAPTRYKRDALPKDDPNHGDYASKQLQVAWLAWQASRAAPAVQGEPVAWMHDSPGRVDVIHAAVKKLLVDSHDTAGYLHRPLDKSEHYTVPLYAAPKPAPDVSALVEALEKIAAFQPKDILCGSGWKEWNRAGEYAASIARDALAAHRKQEPSHDNQ